MKLSHFLNAAQNEDSATIEWVAVVGAIYATLVCILKFLDVFDSIFERTKRLVKWRRKGLNAANPNGTTNASQV